MYIGRFSFSTGATDEVGKKRKRNKKQTVSFAAEATVQEYDEDSDPNYNPGNQENQPPKSATTRVTRKKVNGDEANKGGPAGGVAAKKPRRKPANNPTSAGRRRALAEVQNQPDPVPANDEV